MKNLIVKNRRNKGRAFDLILGLQQEIDRDAAAAHVLQPLKDPAERILKDREQGKTTGLGPMDELAAITAEKDVSMQAVKVIGLPASAFSVSWLLRCDATLKALRVDPMKLAKEAEELLHLRYATSGKVFKALLTARVPGWRYSVKDPTAQIHGKSLYIVR